MNGTAPRSPARTARSPDERAFLAIGPGAGTWLVEAASAGAVRIRSKMARAVELSVLVGAARVDEALALAASAGRFAEGDLVSICDHLAAHDADPDATVSDETFSIQPGTGAWAAYCRAHATGGGAGVGGHGCSPRRPKVAMPARTSAREEKV